MKNILTGLLVILSLSCVAQQIDENYFFHDISVDYGIFASLSSDFYHNLSGNKLSIQTSYYFRTSHMGIRPGISFINNLESTNKFYELPVQFFYRTHVNKSPFILGTVNSIGDFIFKMLISFIPRQTEFYGGVSLGYIEPDNNLGWSSINGGPYVQRGYIVQQRFVTTLDAGIRLHYKIRRVSIFLAPYISYLLTENFKYYMGTGYDPGDKPRRFINFSVGLAYQF